MSISKAISRQATNSLSPSSGVFNPKISNVAATALQTKGNVHITIPQKFFSFNTAPVQDNGTTTTTKTPSTPASRFQKRNEFFLRRHVSRDHIIRAQHYDIRIAAISMTETLKDAVRRHKMIKEEASYWGPFAAGTTMYASFLRGDERVKVELAANNLDYPWNVEDEASPINTLYVEGFAVGEVRGFANFDQIRALRFPPETETKTSNKTEAVVIEKESESTNENENESESENKIETLSTNPLELPDIIPAGDGIMKVTKIMYGADRPYTSTLRTTGNPTSDWQEFYNQSEQVPTYLFFSSDIDKNNRRSPRINATTLRSAEDIILAEDDIEFCGGVLIQVLAGPSDPELATRILSQRAELSSIDDELNTTTISEIEGESKAPFDLASLKDLPSVDLDTPSYENETDDEYVKRIQLEQLRNRAQALDMPKIMKQNGVAGFVAALLDIDVESLGKSPSYKQGNVDNEYDFESLENHLIQTTNLPEGITEEMLHESDKYQCKKWQYRPVAFFCRCTQTPPVEKLQQLPNTLLHELVEDGGAEFTCEYCNTHTVISLDQITQALHEKQHSSIPVPEAK